MADRFSLYGNELKRTYARRAQRWQDMFAGKFAYDPDEAYTLDKLEYQTTSLSVGAFLQDSWSIDRLVTLNLGFRYDAQFLFAIAENDDESDPDAKNLLREAYASANLQAEIEVYEGTLHGWCPPDSAVYHEEQAERAWSRLLALFETALG